MSSEKKNGSFPETIDIYRIIKTNIIKNLTLLFSIFSNLLNFQRFFFLLQNFVFLNEHLREISKWLDETFHIEDTLLVWEQVRSSHIFAGGGNMKLSKALWAFSSLYLSFEYILTLFPFFVIFEVNSNVFVREIIEFVIFYLFLKNKAKQKEDSKHDNLRLATLVLFKNIKWCQI